MNRHSMRRTMIAKTVFVGLVLIGLTPAAARAELFDYNFGTAASGTFTTGAASSTDPGYFLVTQVTVSGSFVNVDPPAAGTVAVSITSTTTSTTFRPDAAFDPTTGAFINHFIGSTFDDLGDVGTTGTINGEVANAINGLSFSSGSDDLSIRGAINQYDAKGALQIHAAAVPEPGSLALLGTALAGLGLIRRRRRSV